MRKKIIILILIIVISVLFFVIYQKVYVSNFKQDDIDDKKNLPSIDQQIESINQKYSTIENQTTKETKVDNEIYSLALEKNNSEICSFLSNDKNKEICLKRIALQLFDVNLCKIINNQKAQDDCSNEVILAKVENDKTLLPCNQITDEMLQITCLEKIIAQGIARDDCLQIPLRYSPRTPENSQEIELSDLCISKVLYKQAVVDNNVSLCEEIPIHYIKAKCLGKLKSIPLDSDYDNDSLNYYEEIIYETNIDNPDTDGDGYLDGDEVNSGYSPNGPGKLLH